MSLCHNVEISGSMLDLQGKSHMSDCDWVVTLVPLRRLANNECHWLNSIEPVMTFIIQCLGQGHPNLSETGANLQVFDAIDILAILRVLSKKFGKLCYSSGNLLHQLYSNNINHLNQFKNADQRKQAQKGFQ